MPNPHFDVKIISRKAGKSAVASASYRSGERLYDKREGRTFDYTRKDDVKHTEIITPANVPEWVNYREDLWNGVEANENRKDAQLARDIIAALPRELSIEQNTQLVRDFVNENFVAKGMIADMCIHEAIASDGGKNPHVHIMLTLREVSEQGFGNKNRSWNDRDLVTDWRASWENITNDALESAGSDERLSLQSYEEQGIDKTPTEHLGHEQWNLEKKGIETAKGDENRSVNHDNMVKEMVSNTSVDQSENDIMEEIEEHKRELPKEPQGSIKEREPALGDVTAKQAHQKALEKNFDAPLFKRLHMHTTLVQRLETFGRDVVDKAKTIGKTIFDKFSSWTNREESLKDNRWEDIDRER